MGSRGPIKRAKPSKKPAAKASRKRRKATKPVATAYAHPARAPKAPSGLGVAGKATWRAIWAAPQVMNGDATTIEQLCRLEDQSAALRAALEEHGSILKEPIISPKGDVVGERHVANPSLRELRRTGAETLALCKELGLSPQARARLGLAVIDVEVKADALDELRARRARRLGLPLPVPGEDRIV